MDFRSIAGQKAVIDNLVNCIRSDTVGHAYTFCGPEGIGKRTVAKTFSALLLCAEAGPYSSCGVCQPCRLLNSGSNPDFYIIDTSAASISVDDIRVLQSDIIIRPMYGRRKVYLIINAEKMTVQAQNCLLKTLEEPPEYATIILTTSNYETLLETIRSRAAKYSFRKNTPEEIRNFLQTRYESIDCLDFILSYSDGVIGTALKLIDSNDFLNLREKVIEIIIKINNSKLLYIFEAYEFFEESKNEIERILDIMSTFYRDVLVAKSTGKQKILINSDKKDIILGNASGYSLHKLMRNIEAIEEARKNISQNVNYQLSIEVMLMKLQEEEA